MNTTQEVTVELILPSGQSLGKSAVPSTHTAAMVISEMADIFQLPRREGKVPIEYELFWEQQGHIIPKSQSLLDAGVQPNNKLRLRIASSAPPPPPPAPAPGGSGDASARHVPEQPKPGDKEVSVTLEFMVDNYSKEPVKETLLLDDTVGSIIEQLVKRLGLPREGNGRPLVYELRSKALGIRLPDHATLRDKGVPNHDNLKLAADKPAGAVACAGARNALPNQRRRRP